jgi:hypothetical protein
LNLKMSGLHILLGSPSVSFADETRYFRVEGIEFGY